jgi:hypothetical protein
VNEIQTKRKQEEVATAVTDYLKTQNFKEIDYKGEKVWKKGLGLMLGPQYVKFASEPGKLRLEAWIRFALLPGVYVGEMGITGAFGMIPKRKLKARVEEIEKLAT